MLAWCCDEGYAAIPYGGGTSVCGGVEPRLPGEYPGVVTIDLGALDRVLEVDEVSRSARIQAGAPGPVLEDQLRERGLTMRCFPQSFEFSTLGGWVATRAGGHFATKLTHVDDMVESVRAITPAGVWESRRLPGSGAGPSPDRMLIGSEGILGVITRGVGPRAAATALQDLVRSRVRVVRCGRRGGSRALAVRPRPVELPPSRSGRGRVHRRGRRPERPPGARIRVRASPGRRADADRGRGGARARRRRPARCELRTTRQAGEDSRRRVALGVPVGSVPARLARLARRPLGDVRDLDHLGALRGVPRHRDGDGARRRWGSRARSPAASRTSIPNGPAPYFTILAPARRGDEAEQWDEIKAAVSDALIDAGGTITHHHAVGRDHRPWYDRQRPEPFAEALRAAKRALDPAGVLNPGVLIDPAT